MTRARGALLVWIAIGAAGCASTAPPPPAPPTPTVAARKAPARSVPRAAKPAPPAPPDRSREVEDLYRGGLAAQEEGREADALRLWEEAYALDPKHADLHEHLKTEYLIRGLDAYADGRLEESVAFWEKAVNVAPQDKRARAYLERALEERARTREITVAGKDKTP